MHPAVEWLGAYSWRLIGIGVVAWVALRLLGTVRIVGFPRVVAVFLTVLLATLTPGYAITAGRRSWRR